MTNDSKGRPQVFFVGDNNDVPDYPYIEVQPKIMHNTEQTSLDRSDETYTFSFSINCYSNLIEDAYSMADDIMTLIWDPTYYHVLEQNNIAVVSCVNNGDSLATFANLMDISAQSLTLTMRIRRQYQSKYFIITTTNLGPDKPLRR